jgi:hypothetical protein
MGPAQVVRSTEPLRLNEMEVGWTFRLADGDTPYMVVQKNGSGRFLRYVDFAGNQHSWDDYQGQDVPFVVPVSVVVTVRDLVSAPAAVAELVAEPAGEPVAEPVAGKPRRRVVNLRRGPVVERLGLGR